MVYAIGMISSKDCLNLISLKATTFGSENVFLKSRVSILFSNATLFVDQKSSDQYVYDSDSSYYLLIDYYRRFDLNSKMEIWNIKDSPDQFKTEENWPQLYNWYKPHLFIVPDSFFPDH